MFVISMKRCNNWPSALELFIEEKRHQPFDWAHNNCAFFACDWIAILVGIDPAAKLRARVISAVSAARALKQRGGLESIAAKAFARQRWPEVKTIFAQRGDVVVTDTDDGPALGVSLGEKVAFMSAAGLTFRSIAYCRRAWRIG